MANLVSFKVPRVLDVIYMLPHCASTTSYYTICMILTPPLSSNWMAIYIAPYAKAAAAPRAPIAKTGPGVTIGIPPVLDKLVADAALAELVILPVSLPAVLDPLSKLKLFAA
jgi:hypothetical protein